MTINTSVGPMILNDDDYASGKDRTEIISSLTRHDDDGAEFRALCAASTHFGRLNSTFHRDCEAWLDGYRQSNPVAA